MPLEPTWQEVIAEAIESRLLELHTAIPGKVISYDAAKQTAEVLPVVQRADPNEEGGRTLTRLPVIPNVPVQWPRGGTYALHLPLAKDDHVLLVFSESAIGHWRASGEVAPPGDLRRCSIGYPIAIPGIAPDAVPIADPGTSGEAVLTVGAGVFRIGGASAELVALANLVQQALDAIQQKFDAHTHVVATTGSATAQSGNAAAVIPAQAIGPLGPVACEKLKAQ
jgi:hypothetical protein